MIWLEVCFWLAALCVVYAYALYPLLLGLAARLRPRPPSRHGPTPRSLSIVLAAHNEESQIERRLDELVALAAATGLAHEIIVVSDGSSDATAGLARGFSSRGVRVVELAENVGKAAALSVGCAEATGEVLVFADARQSWASDAIPRLLENFADPTVGAASGDLVVESEPGVLAGVKLYWRYEKWIRRQESRLHSSVGATGSISAVRRELFRPIPPGTILDDVYWPLQVVLQGRRVIHDERARAFDRLPEKASDEFRRKLRTLSGNYQLASRLPAALLPWRSPVWLQLLSHKLLRLMVPWALIALLAVSPFLPGPFYAVAFWTQVIFYLIGLVSITAGRQLRSRLAGAAAAFLVLNGAAWLAFWVWVTGRTAQTWPKVIYKYPPRECGMRNGDCEAAATPHPSRPVPHSGEVVHP